jgi:hypothetical protein
VADLAHGARVALATDAAGGCVFLEGGRRGRCAVHRRLGEDALPSACRQFPRVVTLTPLGVSVTLSHYCPTAAGMLFADDPALRVLVDPPGFPPSWPYAGLDAREALPPLLRPGVLMDWPSLELWEGFAVSVLGDERLSPEGALDVLASAVEQARRWTPDGGPFAEFFARTLDLSSPGAPSESGVLGVTEAWPLVADCVPHRALLPPPPEGLGEADGHWVAPHWPALARPIRRWLAAKAFASWPVLQGDGLRTAVLGLRVALAVLRAEAARGVVGAGRVLDGELLKEAVRRADLLLVHLADPEALARRLSRCESAEAPPPTC